MSIKKKNILLHVKFIQGNMLLHEETIIYFDWLDGCTCVKIFLQKDTVK